MLEGTCGHTRIAYGFIVSATIADYSFAFGRVPKWSKGTDCKSVIRGFESHLGLCGPVGVSGRAVGFSRAIGVIGRLAGFFCR